MTSATFTEAVCARCHKPLLEIVAQFRCLECGKVFCKKHHNEHTCYVPRRPRR